MPTPILEICADELETSAKNHAQKTVFCENGKAAITYAGLLDFADKFSNSFKKQPTFFCLRLGRGAEEAAVMVACLRDGIPGFSAEKAMPPLYLRGVLEQLAPTHLVTRESAWRNDESVAAVQGTEIFRYRWPGAGEDTLIIATGLACACPANAAWVLLTSGSTGRRKAAAFTPEALHTRALGEVRDFRLKDSDYLLNFLSFAHDLGLNQLLTTILLGATMDIRTRTLASDLIPVFMDGGHHGVTATPKIWQNLLDVIGDSPCQFTGLRFLTISGGGLTTVQMNRLASVFPSSKIICTYGQTETFRTFFSIFPDDGKPGLFYRVVSGVSAKFIGGELIHSGPSTCCALLHGKEWKPCPSEIQTGDLFSQEADGGYLFQGRKDQMVKRLDNRLYLSEVENEILDCGLFSEAAVFLIARDQLAAFVVPSSKGRTMQESELKREIGRRLPYYMVPDRIYFRKELPLTEAMKLNRELLREEMNATLS